MQVVFAHPPHRCFPSSGDRQPTLFVAGYGRMVSAFFKEQRRKFSLLPLIQSRDHVEQRKIKIFSDLFIS